MYGLFCEHGRHPGDMSDLTQGNWQAKGTQSGTIFSGIDLSEGEWFDYDEKVSEEVSIRDIRWEIRRA